MSAIQQVVDELKALTEQRDKLLAACRAILTHDVSNLGTPNEFFRCYTYGYGNMPPVIQQLKDAIALCEVRG